MTTHTNPYLAGNFAPVEDEITATELEVEGAIPAELSGRPGASTGAQRRHDLLGHGLEGLAL